jgi:Protein of unknown function (DUF998)
MGERPMVWALAGPGAFALAAFVGGRRVPGYRPRDEPISALAAHGSRAANVMVSGFLGLATATAVLARRLDGTTVAPDPVPALVVLAGLTTAGAGLARCSDRSCPTRWLGDTDTTRSDDLHAVFSAATFALWIATPLLAARRATEADESYRTWSRRLGWFTLAVLLAGGMLARRPSGRGSGVAQRAMLASAFAWFPLAAMHARRANSVGGRSR